MCHSKGLILNSHPNAPNVVYMILVYSAKSRTHHRIVTVMWWLLSLPRPKYRTHSPHVLCIIGREIHSVTVTASMNKTVLYWLLSLPRPKYRTYSPQCHRYWPWNPFRDRYNDRDQNCIFALWILPKNVFASKY